MSQLTGPDNTHSSIPHTNTQQRHGCSLKYLILAVHRSHFFCALNGAISFSRNGSVFFSVEVYRQYFWRR
jgi:hypothetical protein